MFKLKKIFLPIILAIGAAPMLVSCGKVDYVSKCHLTDFNITSYEGKNFLDNGIGAVTLKKCIDGDTTHFNQIEDAHRLVKWKKGDVVELTFPMHNSVKYLPNVPQYIALMHGPILLGMKTGTEDLAHLIADDSRFGQYASGRKLPINEAPILINDHAYGARRGIRTTVRTGRNARSRKSAPGGYGPPPVRPSAPFPNPPPRSRRPATYRSPSV